MKNDCNTIFDAVSHGQAERVSVLIQLGHDVNIQDHKGRTALHLACRSGHLGIALKLIESGSDLYIQDKEGRTARDLAEDCGYIALADLLTEYSKGFITKSERDRHRSQIRAIRNNVSSTPKL